MSLSDVSMIRTALLEAYAAGVQAVEGERVVFDWLNAHPVDRSVALIALGKAAGAMALGAQRALAGHLWRGLVLTKHGHAGDQALDMSRFSVCEASHPVPDESSLAAGRALLDFVATVPPDMPVLVLVSGGASSLVEVLADGVDLATLAQVNSWLLANGMPIGQMNAVRRRLSRLKGGGLARLLAPRPVTGLLISDVEGDEPAVIGSGPLSAPTDAALPGGLPDWMGELLAAIGDAPAGDTASAGSAQLQVIVVATLDDALAAAEKSLQARGIAVCRHRQHLDGDLAAVARRVSAAATAQPAVVQLFGGEATLVLPADPGRGGRNQHLALQLAVAMAGDIPAVALSAGTDGTDGPTDDAGALVDNCSVDRGLTDGLDAADHLRRADAGQFLEHSGDLVTTGPTGTNVTDLVMAWRA